jgi:tRNA(Ile)-lysidine synthase
MTLASFQAPDHSLATELRSFLSRHDVRNAGVLVSVSGGADSTALLLLLCGMRDEFGLTLRAAHFNHGIRDESEDEARWVADLCHSCDVDVAVERLAVTDGAPADTATGIEERARSLRYAALESLAQRLDCRFVAVGHTLNDQVETVMHRLLRGTGLWGLAGIRECRDLGSAKLIRPLLSISREQIEAYLTSAGQSWRVDASNLDPRWTRNRIRHELLPLLRRDFNPRIDEVVLSVARHAGEVMVFVERQAAEVSAAALLNAELASQKWNAERLRLADFFLRAEALRLQWRRLGWSESAMTRSHWESLAKLAEAAPPAKLSLPEGVLASRRGKLLVLEKRAAFSGVD